jgi:hypothetical protein
MNTVTVNRPTRSTNRDRDERFFHIKPRNEGEVWVLNDGQRTISRITAFTRKDKDGKVYASYAECDERDQFCKRVGRTVARRKWFAGKRIELDPAGVNYETLLAKFENGEV